MQAERNNAIRLPDLHSEAQAELEKDVWDAWKLPGVRVIMSQNNHTIRFTRVPPAFRPAIKRYIRLKIVQLSFGECVVILKYIHMFAQFYSARCPQAITFGVVDRVCIEEYILYVTAMKKTDGQPVTPRFRWEAVVYLYRFFEYLQRTSSPDSPVIPVGRLIWPEDRGRWKQSKTKGVYKHIPSTVLEQLDRHIDKLEAVYVPIVIVLLATGLRISDVLDMRYDTCLEQTASGWLLCADVNKTQVKRHKLPVTEEVAKIVAVQREYVRSTSTDAENPNRYLFPSEISTSSGQPIKQARFSNALNKFAARNNIVGPDGSIYRFRAHAFRHTKAMELLNNGMRLELVQKWLAHASPEMTLHYAQLSSDTMRRAWEDAFAQGAVRIGESGDAEKTAPLAPENDDLELEYLRHNLDAVSLPNGYCFKARKIACPTQAIPCHTCSHFCTTREFLPQFETQRMETLHLIELCDAAGRTQAGERNRQNLIPLESIITALKDKGIKHDAGKAVREYTPEEAAERENNGR